MDQNIDKEYAMKLLRHELLKQAEKLQEKLREGKAVYSLVLTVNAINVLTIEIQALQDELKRL